MKQLDIQVFTCWSGSHFTVKCLHIQASINTSKIISFSYLVNTSLRPRSRSHPCGPCVSPLTTAFPAMHVYYCNPLNPLRREPAIYLVPGS